MIVALCREIEASRAETLRESVALDCRILDVFMSTHGRHDREFFGRHGLGLVGNLTGALRLFEEVLPGLRWDVRNTFGGAPICTAVIDITNGRERPFVGVSSVAANAFLAAGIRAYFGAVELPAPVAVNDDVPSFVAANDERRAEA